MKGQAVSLLAAESGCSVRVNGTKVWSSLAASLTWSAFALVLFTCRRNAQLYLFISSSEPHCSPQCHEKLSLNILVGNRIKVTPLPQRKEQLTRSKMSCWPSSAAASQNQLGLALPALGNANTCKHWILPQIKYLPGCKLFRRLVALQKQVQMQERYVAVEKKTWEHLQWTKPWLMACNKPNTEIVVNEEFWAHCGRKTCCVMAMAQLATKEREEINIQQSKAKRSKNPGWNHTEVYLPLTIDLQVDRNE